MIRENRYVVLKMTDVDNYCTQEEMMLVAQLNHNIRARRLQDGKEARKYVIVQDNWPEYDKVWDMIEERVDAS